MVKIFVGNCSDSSTSEDLRACFGRYGRVLEADVLDGKGFGFVHMESPSQADAAVAALDGVDFKGRKLRVEISTGRSGGGGGGGRGGGGPQRNRGGGDRNRGYGGGDRNGSFGRSGSGGGGRGPPRGRRGGGSRDYDNHRGGRGGGGRDYDAPSSRNSYGSPRGGGGGRSYDDPYRSGGGDYAPPSRYRDSSPPSYGSRDRYESRAPLQPPPVERYRPYDSYERRGPAPDDVYSRGGRGASPPSVGGYYGRSRSPLPSPPRRSPPRSYGTGGMGPGSIGGAGNPGRYMNVTDIYDEARRASTMMRGRSPPPARGPPMRQMM